MQSKLFIYIVIPAAIMVNFFKVIYRREDEVLFNTFLDGGRLCRI